MNLTILLRLALAVLVLPLAAPSWAEEYKDHKLRAKFDPADCEAWLAENDAMSRASLIGGFPQFPSVGIVVERVGVMVPPLIDLASEDPDFVWFTSPKNAKPKEIAEQVAVARADARGFSERPPFDPKKFDFNAPLGEFEMDALGIEFDRAVGPKGVRGQAFASAEGWRIVWRIRGQTVGELRLFTRDAQIAYTNAVHEFQWDMIASQRLRGRAVKDLVWPTVQDFIFSNGHGFWLRTSEKSGQRFGYALRSYELSGHRWVYQLEVYKVRSTPRRAASPADIVFPGAFDPPFGAELPQMMNLQVIDVGLRLPLDPNPTNE